MVKNINKNKKKAIFLLIMFLFQMFHLTTAFSVQSTVNGSASKYGSNRNEAITYDFYNSFDTFQSWNSWVDCWPQMINHNMRLNITGSNPSIKSEDNINLNASIYKYIRIKMKNNSTTSSAKVSFITTADQTWDQNKTTTLAIRTTDVGFYEYVFDFSSLSSWTGTIKQLRFELVSGVANTTVEIDYIKIDTENQNPGSISYQFNYDTNGWGGQSGCSVNYNRGIVKLIVSSNDPKIYSPNWLGINPQTVKYIRVKMKNTSLATAGKLYWISNTDTTYNETKSQQFTISANSSEFVEYTIDLSSKSSWTNAGTIKRICLDPVEGVSVGFVEIDYIILDTINPTGINYDFNNGISGWTSPSYTLSGGILTVNANSGDPQMYSPSGLNIDASKIKYIKINMKNNTYSNLGQIFWTTSTDTIFDQKKCQNFTVKEMDSGYTLYTIGLNQNQYWNGTITQIRIDPFAWSTSGNAQMKAVSISTDGDTTNQNQKIEEGFLANSTKYWLSGWNIDQTGGSVSGFVDKGNKENIDWNGVNLSDISNELRVSVSKEIVPQSTGQLEWDLQFKLDDSTVNGVEWKLMDGIYPIIHLKMLNNGYLSALPSTTIQKINANQWYKVKVIVNLDGGNYSIWVDGQLKSSNLNFSNTLSKIDSIYIGTPMDGKVKMYIDNRLYKVGYMYEDFLIDATNAAPSGLTVGGSGGSAVVNESLVLSDNSASGNVSVSKTFAKTANGYIEFETNFLFSAKQDGVTFKLMNGTTDAIVFLTNSGNLCYTTSTGTNQTLWSNYKANVWYSLIVRVNIITKKSSFYINGVVKAGNVDLRNSVSSIDGFTAFTSVANTGNVSINKIRVAPYITTTIPYIDKVSSTTGNVGMQAWFATVGNAWDRVENKYNTSDKTPYLGYYDDLNPQAVDWQVKWMAEHGIDFFSSFVYTNMTTPFDGRSLELTDTFIKKSQSNSNLKFAITWGEISDQANISYNNIMNNVVPYFVESYFKNPQYLVIDNKPVLITYSWKSIVTALGTAGAKSVFDGIRQECMNAGFSGAIIIGEQRGGLDGTIVDPISDAISVGLDYIYGYCNTFNSTALNNYTSQGKTAGIDVIASPGVGWDNRYWATDDSGVYYATNTPSQYGNMLDWIKNSYFTQSGFNKGATSLAKSMVLLDNWSEFGEGHSIQPSSLYGFGYLNSIRKSFTTANESHGDVSPEGPFNALYLEPNSYNDPLTILNVANGKTITASSSGYASNAVDGNLSTLWCASSGAFPQWLKVDLGSNFDLCKTTQTFYTNDVFTYKIEGSLDDVNWTTIADKTSNTVAGPEYNDYVSGTYRYVKITFLSSNPGNWATSREFQIFATATNVSKNKTVTASSSNDASQAYSVDGDKSTYWCASSGAFPQWLKVDLGSTFDLCKTTQTFYTNDVFTYKIEGSLDDVTWTTLADKTSNTAAGPEYNDYVSGTYRYVKITFLSSDPGNWATSREFQIFATASNVSKGKTITASCGGNASYAVDGDISTNWCSSSGTFPQWLKVDLGSLFYLCKTTQTFYTNDVFTYKIEGSLDDVTWTTLADRTSNTTTGPHYTDLVKGTYRYVKITFLSSDPGNWATSKEFAVFGIPSTWNYQGVVNGITDGEVYDLAEGDLIVTFSEGSATLNGNEFLGGSSIGEIGTYSLVLSDINNNIKTLNFTVIDTSYPIVSGVHNGGVYNSKSGELTINFNKGTALLNGSPFTNGANINATGVYNLIVNSNNSTSINFTYIKYGDTNGDGNVNASDLALIKKHLLNIKMLIGIYKNAADINENGNVSIGDIMIVKKNILGIIHY